MGDLSQDDLAKMGMEIADVVARADRTVAKLSAELPQYAADFEFLKGFVDTFGTMISFTYGILTPELVEESEKMGLGDDMSDRLTEAIRLKRGGLQ